MPVMTREDLHRFLEQEFPQAPPGFSVESVEDTLIRVRQKTEDRHLRPGGTISGPTLMAMAPRSHSTGRTGVPLSISAADVWYMPPRSFSPRRFAMPTLLMGSAPAGGCRRS